MTLPLYADFAKLPPIVIHVGADEILLSDSTRLAEKAGDAGLDVQIKIWQGMCIYSHSSRPSC